MQPECMQAEQGLKYAVLGVLGALHGEPWLVGEVIVVQLHQWLKVL